MRSMSTRPTVGRAAWLAPVALVGLLGACGQGVRSTGAEPAASTTAPGGSPTASLACAPADASVRDQVAAGLAKGWDVVEVALAAGADGDGLAVAVRARKDDNFGAFVYGEGVLYAEESAGPFRPVGEARFWPGDRAEAPSWLSDAAQDQLLACVH